MLRSDIDLGEERVVKALIVAAFDIATVGVRAVIGGVLSLDGVADLLWRDPLRVRPDEVPDKLEESAPRAGVGRSHGEKGNRSWLLIILTSRPSRFRTTKMVIFLPIRPLQPRAGSSQTGSSAVGDPGRREVRGILNSLTPKQSDVAPVNQKCSPMRRR